MRRALVAAVIMSVTLTGAAPAAHAKPKPRTLVVTVSGLPKGTAAKVRVKGPKKYHKVLSVRRQKAVKRLRPGVYRATVKPVRGYTARVKPRKARVTNKRGARLRISFTAEQPPEPEDDTLPTQPWPNLPGPQSITAVSTTASGVFGNDVSDFPSWSPDGTRIVFSSCATNLVAPTTGCYAYVKTLSNGSLAKLDKARLGSSYDLLNDWSGETQWARVGDKIAFTTMEQLIPTDTDEIKDVYTIDPLGATVTRPYPALSGGIVPLAESPRWSPTSDQLAFRSTAANLAGGTGEVYVTPLLSRLGTADPVAGLQWTRDGTALFYIAGDYTGDDDVPSTFDVFRQSPGGSPQRLTSGWQASFGQLSAAPDGRVAATFRSTLKRLLLAGIPIFLLLFIGIRYLFAPVFGAEWEEAGGYAQILLPFFFIRFISATLSTTMTILEKLKQALVVHLSIIAGNLLAFGAAYRFQWDFERFLYLYVMILSFLYTIFLIYYYRLARGEKKD